jgi:hypothetical protein
VVTLGSFALGVANPQVCPVYVWGRGCSVAAGVGGLTPGFPGGRRADQADRDEALLVYRPDSDQELGDRVGHAAGAL